MFVFIIYGFDLDSYNGKISDPRKSTRIKAPNNTVGRLKLQGTGLRNISTEGSRT